MRTFVPAPSLPPGRPRLVVTGFMGTGKTTAGAAAASLLRLPFVDLDELIAARAGRSVTDLFAELGEPEFRGMERQVVGEAALLSGTVVATGGGAVEDGSSFGRLAEGAVVAVLECGSEELRRRLGSGSDRPMLRPDPDARIESLLARRAPLYAAAGRALDTTDRSPEDVAVELARRYREAGDEGPVRVLVHGPDGPYPVVIGTGAIRTLGSEVPPIVPEAAGVAVVADAAVASVAERVGLDLEAAGLPVACRIALPPGEVAKSAQVVADAWSRLREAGLGPRDLLVAVGGGAALDAAGFVAATYVRGMALVNVPTTLLGMVDASLGGKVAIDHAGVKNLVGSFHHPRLVVADPDVLVSLPARERRAGLVEAVKGMVLASPLALDVLEAHSSTDPGAQDRGIATMVDWVVEQAVRVKAAYVALDPRDNGPRHALNLGHTFGHAIEAATDHSVLHGEAVAVGMLAAVRLGASKGVTPPGLEARLRGLLERLGLPTRLPTGLDRARLLDAMTVDKKRRQGRPVFVLPVQGGALLVDDVSAETAVASLLSDRSVEERAAP